MHPATARCRLVSPRGPSEDAQQRDLKGEKVKVECQQRENEVGDGREEERGCNISITEKAAGDQRSHGGDGWMTV